MTEKWMFINSGPQSASYNMALDDALLELHSKGRIPPVVRFYEWNPATLSIGYFQKATEAVDLEKVKEMGLGFVRRPTGGRAVLHDRELTYSIIVSESHPDMPETVTEAYRVISAGLLEGFRNLGLQAEFAIPATREERNALKEPKSAVCFDAPSWYELVVEGRKAAGSAQTRQKGVILQHGAIPVSLDLDKLVSVFNFKTEDHRSRMKEKLAKKAVSIEELSGRSVEMPEVTEAFRSGFEKALDIELIGKEPDEEILELVRRLEEEKYSNDSWNFKK
ncbi:Octanoyltransferase LipM [Bhargavaea cecembensis DSE10]|uniref:Octanoyltransferase LipM n=1 Tax=Bhargavaea cecembensis DSE10 TaxID=1235279 RepID=M7P822_9BACL|nr:biotin/lipoate A/B protein ligase family protein [Bhargavaea cecembensis]EMR06664.1 Octanoyltransferase LipM [Bhargavaea cecembensis DSE10]